jgi:hypothetical protein
VERCHADGLVLVYLRECEQCEISQSFCDTRIDPADYPRSAGFNYGVRTAASSHCIIRHNTIKNCVNDGIKIGGRRTGTGRDRWENLLYGEQVIIEGNRVSGCVNDDAIDIYNSGDKVIITSDERITLHESPASDISTEKGVSDD